MIDLENFPEHLKNISREDWEKLFNLIPEINHYLQLKSATENRVNNFHKLLKGFNKIIDPPDKLISSFISVAYELEIVIVFDWTNWAESKIILENENQDYSEISLIDLCKLITVIIRADRFNEGFILKQLDNGNLLKILNSIRESIRTFI